jgi:23S rRNA pseudouridine1911/1915/1917 synthase
MPNVLQDWLREQFPQAKQNTLRQMLSANRVRVNGVIARKMNRPIKPNDKIEVSDRVRIQPPEENSLLHPLELIHEDDYLLVVNKPPGLLTSTVPTETRPTALAIISRYLYETDPEANLGLIHRLDRDASGLLVFSKTPEVFRALKHQFYKHSVRREYLAITRGVPTPLTGRITSFLSEQPDGSVRSTKNEVKGQKAVSDYQTLARKDGLAAIRVTLQTGRKHQIRAHLFERGVPVLGDRMYGSPHTAPRLMLAAMMLQFDHPGTQQRVGFELPVPSQFPLLAGKKISEIPPIQPKAAEARQD